MIHPLVVAIDSTDSSQRAQTVSLDLAKQFSASVTGIAVLDTAWIRRPMATPIGGRAYKAHRDETLIQHQHEELEAKIKAFDELCKKAGVKSRSLEVEGSPSEKLDREAEQHDVLVLGRETNFHGTRDNDIGEATDKLLKDHPRPIIVVPPGEPLTGEGIVISFDGCLPSSRAMHMCCLFGLTKDQPVHAVTVNEDSATAERIADRGANFSKNRGVEAIPHGVSSDEDSGEIASTVFHLVEIIGADMLVMGAYAKHCLWRQLLVGSVTKQMSRACPVPLFVHY